MDRKARPQQILTPDPDLDIRLKSRFRSDVYVAGLTGGGVIVASLVDRSGWSPLIIGLASGLSVGVGKLGYVWADVRRRNAQALDGTLYLQLQDERKHHKECRAENAALNKRIDDMKVDIDLMRRRHSEEYVRIVDELKAIREERDQDRRALNRHLERTLADRNFAARPPGHDTDESDTIP